MLFVISPAKTLDFTPPPPEIPASQRTMTADTALLSRTTRTLSAGDLKRLMDISDNLAELNRARFKAFKARDVDGGVQAAMAFAGDVYDGLDARNLGPDDLDWAQGHLRILSGLYGLLRPLDRIQPYRLEMGTRLANPRGESLYDFWGDRLSKALNKQAREHKDRTLVNLASQEYFGAVDRRALKIPVHTCQFKEEKDGETRVISFYAKQARGLMARFAIENRIETVDELRAFDLAGYSFSRGQSSDLEWVFSRPQPAPVAIARAA